MGIPLNPYTNEPFYPVREKDSSRVSVVELPADQQNKNQVVSVVELPKDNRTVTVEEENAPASTQRKAAVTKQDPNSYIDLPQTDAVSSGPRSDVRQVTDVKGSDPNSSSHGGDPIIKRENGGTTLVYPDGYQIFKRDPKVARNIDGLTAEEMSAQSGAVTYNEDGTRELTEEEQAEADYLESIRPRTPEEIAEEERLARERNLERQNEAISSIDTMYDNLLADIAEDNRSRTGSGAAINALSGQRGSNSGAAAADRIEDKNQDVVDANEAERAAKISQIRGNYEDKIDQDILNATALRKQDAQAYLDYEATKVERGKADSAELRKNFLNAKISPEEMTDEEYKLIAEAGGYTIEEAKLMYEADYNTAKDEFLANESKALAELNKTNAETDKIKADTEKSKADANAKSQENIMIDNGYTYIDNYEDLQKAKDEGRAVEIQGRSYLIPKDTKTDIIQRGDNNILIDKTTGEDIKDLGPAKTQKPSGSQSSNKNYTATTIPPDIKKDLLYDKETQKIEDVMAAYPEVSTSYIQSLYGVNTFNFQVN